MNITISAVIVFVGLAILLPYLRTKSGGSISIQTSEIVTAVIAVGILLFVSGQISEVAFGDVRLVRNIKEAANKPVKEQISGPIIDEIRRSSFRFEETRTFAKGSVAAIPRILERKAKVLSFELGGDYYVGSAIAQHLDELTKAPYLQYLLFTDSSRRMVGIADARAATAQIKANSPSITWDSFTNWIKQSNVAMLSRLPGYLEAKDAIKNTMTTQEALAKMLEINADRLPVVDANGRFIGIAYRAQLMGKILMALSAGVKP